MALPTSKQLRIIAANLLSEVNEGVNDLREGTLPQARTELNEFVDEVQSEADRVLGVVQTFVVDLKAIALKQN